MARSLLMGNEAIAHAALEAGVGVVAGYPGTPSSEIVETVAKLRRQGRAHDVYVEWSSNEKVALEMLFGASLAGARCLFTCKQMGLNVASDALMSLNYVGVRGGLVLIVADDPGPISSQTEQDTRRYAAFAKVPVLDPSTPEQAFDMVKAAFDLSERYKTPVIVRPTTRVDHSSAFFDVADETHALGAGEWQFKNDPEKLIIFPRRSFESHKEINERLVSIADDFSQNELFKSFNPVRQHGDDPDFGIVAGGVSAAYASEALEMLDRRAQAEGTSLSAYRFMQIGTPYPFPKKEVDSFLDGLDQVIVFEELDHVIEDELAMLIGREHLDVEVLGKLTGNAKDRGENSTTDILRRLTALPVFASLKDVDSQASSTIQLDLPVRPPVLCAGCPHRGAFYSTKLALGKNRSVLCGDIGCYTLGNAHPLDAIDTCLCMGAGITMAQGVAAADPDAKAIAFVGDSTFFASAGAALSNASYNNHDITVMVLDNSTTAMTGMQPHPGTGDTLMDEHHEPLSIEEVLAANGFKKIMHADPFRIDESVEAAREAIDYEGPSAVIFKGACAQLTRPKHSVSVDPQTCIGCRKCITSIGCPAIDFNPHAEGPLSKNRGQAVIDASLCNGCLLCTQVCPTNSIAKEAKRD